MALMVLTKSGVSKHRVASLCHGDSPPAIYRLVLTSCCAKKELRKYSRKAFIGAVHGQICMHDEIVRALPIFGRDVDPQAG